MRATRARDAYRWASPRNRGRKAGRPEPRTIVVLILLFGWPECSTAADDRCINLHQRLLEVLTVHLISALPTRVITSRLPIDTNEGRQQQDQDQIANFLTILSGLDACIDVVNEAAKCELAFDYPGARI